MDDVFVLESCQKRKKEREIIERIDAHDLL